MKNIIINNIKQILTKENDAQKNTYHVVNKNIAPSKITGDR